MKKRIDTIKKHYAGTDGIIRACFHATLAFPVVAFLIIVI